ncbi:MAG: M23 family metallopeptidase [Burkholderiaceae bacterium]
MQILITNGSLARTRVLRLNRWQLTLALAGFATLLTLLSGLAYHYIFLKAAREGWPVVSQIMRLIVRDEFAQRDRFLRENLDAIAQKVGEMQAKLVRLEVMSERVSAMVGVKLDEIRPVVKTAAAGAQGGPFLPASSVSLDQLRGIVDALDVQTDQRSDLFTMIESRLFESRLQALMIPNSKPVDVPLGSGFGFRPDPFTGVAALHTGLDFPAEIGTTVVAAAGGVVLLTEQHPQYGNVIELDHGQGVVTRYAHNSKLFAKTGDIVKRGQKISEIGTSGRSTGPHLHFEVRLDGVPQNPAKFLASRGAATLAIANTLTPARVNPVGTVRKEAASAKPAAAPTPRVPAAIAEAARAPDPVQAPARSPVLADESAAPSEP